ncbi:hypothetical protein [Actinomyces procaprae]|uniref:hypothetical protein n=1 Tax=Actinomyces procaprae TaxID=2560010 RepID=UPI0010A290D7|nr:hypothetical protein [Actinomyces procaprae]
MRTSPGTITVAAATARPRAAHGSGVSRGDSAIVARCHRATTMSADAVGCQREVRVVGRLDGAARTAAERGGGAAVGEAVAVAVAAQAGSGPTASTTPPGAG